MQRAVPDSRCAGIRPLRAHLTRVRGAIFKCCAASRLVSHSDWVGALNFVASKVV